MTDLTDLSEVVGDVVGGIRYDDISVRDDVRDALNQGGFVVMLSLPEVASMMSILEHYSNTLAEQLEELEGMPEFRAGIEDSQEMVQALTDRIDSAPYMFGLGED